MEKLFINLREYIYYKIQRYKFKKYQKRMNKKAKEFEEIKKIIRDTLERDKEMQNSVKIFLAGVKWNN